MTSKISLKTLRLCELALLVAVMLAMYFLKFGYIQIGVVGMTIIHIPVIVGAITLGPSAGALLGAVFGATSFIQCFGVDPFGTTLLGISPLGTIVLCFVPRIIMGWLCGVVFKAVKKIDKTNILSFGAASLSGALLNTVLFIAALLLIFGNSDYITSLIDGRSILVFAATFVGINALIEAAVCCVIGTAVSKALYSFIKNEESNS